VSWKVGIGSSNWLLVGILRAILETTRDELDFERARSCTLQISMNDLNEHAFAYVTTIGRVTGRPHTIEIWFAASGNTIYLLSGGGDRSDWVRNLLADGSVEVRIDGQARRGIGRTVTDGAERELARWLVFDKYQPGYGGDLADWRERSLPIAIDLVEALSPES
jgi:deazaflavin-dependent oxidoreductase (nitroreductase family)